MPGNSMLRHELNKSGAKLPKPMASSTNPVEFRIHRAGKGKPPRNEPRPKPKGKKT